LGAAIAATAVVMDRGGGDGPMWLWGWLHAEQSVPGGGPMAVESSGSVELFPFVREDGKHGVIDVVACFAERLLAVEDAP
jgi:hypothetical protein